MEKLHFNICTENKKEISETRCNYRTTEKEIFLIGSIDCQNCVHNCGIHKIIRTNKTDENFVYCNFKNERMTIYDIKEFSRENSPYFFSKDTLKFFGQTLKMFSVKKLSKYQYLISAPSKGFSGQYTRTTKRIFDTLKNDFSRIIEE